MTYAADSIGGLADLTGCIGTSAVTRASNASDDRPVFDVHGLRIPVGSMSRFLPRLPKHKVTGPLK